MHNGLMHMGAEKMSKSLGNLITIRDALKKYSADAIRIFILSSHYRSPLTYTDEAIEAAQGGAERLLRVISKDVSTKSKGKALDAKPYYDRFIEAMDDDFNTPQAIATLFDLANVINQAGDAGISVSESQNILVSLGRQVMGFKLPRVFDLSVTDGIKLRATVDVTKIPGKINNLVNRLIKERLNCRKEKKWQRADEIRNELAELGVILEDSKTVTTATYKLIPSEQSLANLMKELGIDF
jgi:cysteinyl-tRNA synthetase